MRDAGIYLDEIGPIGKNTVPELTTRFNPPLVTGIDPISSHVQIKLVGPIPEIVEGAVNV